MKRKAAYPTKTSMNLFYKPDRTTKISTILLYVLFALVVLLALSKLLVYDLWMENQEAQNSLAAAQERLNSATLALADYSEVQENYFRYSITDDERGVVDRMEVLAMLDGALADTKVDSISINGDQVQLQLSDMTLAKTAEIVRRLEASPLVASTEVNTASASNTGEGEARASVVVLLQAEEAEDE